MAVGGFRASVATPWFAFFSFSVTPGYSTSIEGLSKEVGTVAVLSMPISATSKAVSGLEQEGTDVGWQGVVYTLCLPKYR